MTYYSITSLINFLVSFGLGFFILTRREKTRLHKLVAFFCFAIFFWSFFYFLWQITETKEYALWFTRLLMVGAILAPVAYCKVVLAFLDLEQVHARLVRVSYILTGFFLILLPTKLMVLKIEAVPGFEFWPKPGLFFIPFLVFFFSLTFFSIYLTAKSVLNEKSSYKSRQARLMLLGIALTFIGGSTNYFLWFDINIPPYGNILACSYVILTTYAILRHQLMDIKVVLRKYSVYFVSLFSVIALAGLFQYGYKTILGISNFYIDIIITGLAVSIFPVLRSYYYRFANTYLFTSLYDTKQVISKLSEKLRSTLETEEIYRTLSDTIQNALHIRSIGLLTYDHDKEEYSIAQCEREETCNPVVQKLNKKFVDYLVTHDRPILTAEIDDRFAVLKRLLAPSTEVLVPLNLKGKHIGLMLIGQKEASDSFDDEDVSLLKIVGSQTAIALENALLYGEAQHFNEVLKQRIARATKQLRSQNEKLKELDEMKTEFISIASHQLRTPLTATKWALDFLLKGADGKINPKQRESLSELSVMNVRLITLVNELLNISRIDEGRVKVEPKPTSITKVVKEILAEFMPIIRKKGIILQEHYDTVPLIKLDAGVIGKALSNVLSNGIKYNTDGKHLWVEVAKHKDDVAIIVKDEGIGIPTKEQDHLFQKFYRASNAMTSNTEGTGFGLYIAKSAIELSGGSISFESKEGVGTTFTVFVPLKGSRARKGEKSLA
ncbi:MAG: ATP-binding protein [bacterium]|nr:ATP-binding protein [bacterium]